MTRSSAARLAAHESWARTGDRAARTAAARAGLLARFDREARQRLGPGATDQQVAEESVMTRPRLLDLFCGAGGAAMGYHRAGFDVTGVDIAPQPRYPFEFHQADAIEVLDRLIMPAYDDPDDWLAAAQFDAIHASPVCLTFARVTAWRGRREDHADTLRPTLARLPATGLPWAVENVPEAPLRRDYILCGSQFGLGVRRHRVFQTSWGGIQFTSPCNHHRGLRPFMHKGERAYADAMGCTWMTKEEARQAIPPAYTEHIGAMLLDHLKAVTS